jgi:hypothetical protein
MKSQMPCYASLSKTGFLRLLSIPGSATNLNDLMNNLLDTRQEERHRLPLLLSVYKLCSNSSLYFL